MGVEGPCYKGFFGRPRAPRGTDGRLGRLPNGYRLATGVSGVSRVPTGEAGFGPENKPYAVRAVAQNREVLSEEHAKKE